MPRNKRRQGFKGRKIRRMLVARENLISWIKKLENAIEEKRKEGFSNNWKEFSLIEVRTMCNRKKTELENLNSNLKTLGYFE